MCNSTSTSSQWSAWPSVWPQTKEMWASIHFHVPLCLFCEIRLAFNRCYFSPVRFSLRPVWPEMNWPLLYVIDIGWLPTVTAARPPHQFLGDQKAWRIQTLFFSPYSSPGACETWETATGNLMSPGCQHLKRPRGIAERQRGQCDSMLHVNVTQIGTTCDWKTDSLSSIANIETHPVELTHT